MIKQKRNLNNLNFKEKLETVDEINETNYGINSVFKEISDNQPSIIKSSLNRKQFTPNEYIFTSKDKYTFSLDNKENKEISQKEIPEIQDNNQNFNRISDDNFTKIPKKISSTFTSINQPLFEPESSIKGTNIKTPNLNLSNFNYSNFYNTSQNSKLTYTPNLNRKKLADSLIITNFNSSSLQKVINEFRKFGEIQDYHYNENENKLFIQYENIMSIREAIIKHNPKIDPDKYIAVEPILKSDKPEFYSKIINQNDTQQRVRQFTPDIQSNSVSYLKKILNTIFNW